MRLLRRRLGRGQCSRLGAFLGAGGRRRRGSPAKSLPLPPASLALGGAASALVLALEAAVLTVVLGRVFAGFDVTADVPG